MRPSWLSVALLAGAACHLRGVRLARPAPPGPEVRYRPADPPTGDGRMLLGALPKATWDLGLQRAAEELLSLCISRTAWLDPQATSLAAARAGFPGQARFARIVNGGAFPADLVDGIAATVGAQPIDVALARRDFSDGTALWIVAWAPRVAWVDPLPRDISLDEPIGIRTDLPEGRAGRLFLAEPGGPVDELSLTSGVTRWVDRFHVPGAWRVEVVVDRKEEAEVALLFTVYVDTKPPDPSPLAPLPEAPPDPIAAQSLLYRALDQLRVQHGLRPVERFAPFEPLVREHSALMASQGRAAHVIPGVTDGFARQAADRFQPRAITHEVVAVAPTAKEALALVEDSPAHLANLLCKTCTHASIGAALEPVLDRRPRLFVTWELLEFPHGPPRRIDHYNR